MKRLNRVCAFLRQMRTLPLTWLSLSRGTQLLLVALSYGLGIAGLWLLFPPTHNGATMYLPVVCACWLFRYRGLLVSLVLNGIAFQLTYLFLLRGLLPDSDFVEGAFIGFGTSLGLGLVICWLRTAVDSAHVARRQALAVEHARLRIVLREHEVSLAYEQQSKINALKDQFLLNVNHELRTPLTVLGGTLELLARHHESLDSITRAQILKNALASQAELVALVDRVMDATRVMGDIPVANAEAVNVKHLLQEVLAHLAQELAAYKICLQVPEQVMVWADPQVPTSSAAQSACQYLQICSHAD
jgi:signal transduction histidine kinase